MSKYFIMGGSTIKKVMYAIFTLVLCLTFITPEFANAATNETSQQNSNNVLSLEKSNFNYLEGKPGDTHLVYTYDSNGSTYKVIENSSDNFDEVNSTIYLEDNSGVFVKYSTQKTTVNNNIVTHTTDVNGEVTTETQDLSPKKSDLLNGDVNSPLYSNIYNSLMVKPPVGGGGGCGTYEGYDLTCWEHINTHNGSTYIWNWTVSSVTALVVGIACDGFSLSGPVTGAVSVLVGKIVDSTLPRIYYRQYYYEKRLENPPLALANFVVGSKWHTKWYEDSYHKTYLYSTDEYKYQNGYEG